MSSSGSARRTSARNGPWRRSARSGSGPGPTAGAGRASSTASRLTNSRIVTGPQPDDGRQPQGQGGDGPRTPIARRRPFGQQGEGGQDQVSDEEQSQAPPGSLGPGQQGQDDRD